VITNKFQRAVADSPDKPFLLSSSRQWSYSDFYIWCRSIAERLTAVPERHLACYMADSPQLVAVMLGAALSGKSLMVLNRASAPEKLAGILAQFNIDCLISDAGELEDLPCRQFAANELQVHDHPNETAEIMPVESDGELRILTSGTTGSPKCARYNWEDLFAQVREKPEAEGVRWLLAYRLNHFAGVQMLAHVLGNSSTLVLASSDRVADALTALEKFSVTHMSSTPTFWRFALALLQGDNKDFPLRQITLGSEAVSQGLLDQLKARFPNARIVHIYASTESGSLVSVDDMEAGLPISVLARPEHADVQFRIQEEELYVKSRHGMRAYLNNEAPPGHSEDGWRASGDLIKIEDGRIYFVGRRSETINVGGVKVHPLDVESIVTALEGVTIARVYGQDNPVVGQIVAVDLVVQDNWDHQSVEKSVRKACMVLPRHSRPRRINIVDTLNTRNHKLVRQ
jgi:acyl-CoA synthetase (AMP-forming)/AMP-acid ligase II